MAGFFEFSMMRVRSDIDQPALARLFHQYLNVEEDFVRTLFTGETKMGRAFVQEAVLPELPADGTLTVLDWERASEVAKTATHRGVGVCYCRHKMEHLGRDCDAPKGNCMTFGGTAASLARAGFTREVGVREALDVLQEAQARGLVQFGENVQRGVNFICNCCGCCCEALIAARRFAVLNPIQTTNWLPAVDAAACTGCGACAAACPVEAIGMVSANDPRRPKLKKARVDERVCLGCGVCVRACTHRRAAALAARVAGHLARERRAPGRADGHRARHAPAPGLRQPGPRQPPGHGRGARRDPEAAAGEAADGEPADEVALPRAAARGRM